MRQRILQLSSIASTDVILDGDIGGIGSMYILEIESSIVGTTESILEEHGDKGGSGTRGIRTVWLSRLWVDELHAPGKQSGFRGVVVRELPPPCIRGSGDQRNDGVTVGLPFDKQGDPLFEVTVWWIAPDSLADRLLFKGIVR